MTETLELPVWLVTILFIIIVMNIVVDRVISKNDEEDFEKIRNATLKFNNKILVKANTALKLSGEELNKLNAKINELHKENIKLKELLEKNNIKYDTNKEQIK